MVSLGLRFLVAEIWIATITADVAIWTIETGAAAAFEVVVGALGVVVEIEEK